MPSHRLLLRAGYVRQLGSGLYSLLPLGFRVNEAGRAGHPRGDRTRSAGRRWRCPSSTRRSCGRRPGATTTSGPSWSGSRTAAGRDMVLAMTHEEVVADLLRDIVRSYRQLPIDGLPLPDEVPRRAALARRPDPRPRVRDEGRATAATATRPASTSAYRAHYARLHADLRAPRAPGDRGRLATSG